MQVMNLQGYPVSVYHPSVWPGGTGVKGSSGLRHTGQGFTWAWLRFSLDKPHLEEWPLIPSVTLGKTMKRMKQNRDTLPLSNTHHWKWIAFI